MLYTRLKLKTFQEAEFRKSKTHNWFDDCSWILEAQRSLDTVKGLDNLINNKVLVKIY